MGLDLRTESTVDGVHEFTEFHRIELADRSGLEGRLVDELD